MLPKAHRETTPKTWRCGGRKSAPSFPKFQIEEGHHLTGIAGSAFNKFVLSVLLVAVACTKQHSSHKQSTSHVHFEIGTTCCVVLWKTKIECPQHDLCPGPQHHQHLHSVLTLYIVQTAPTFECPQCDLCPCPQLY